ncbi:MAG: hypothetical protein PHV43_01100 [Candidatus Colwellbacteria bacterium]|nr:hypothetical protein [Candidatus Colwellbacteria bacterium]
MKPQVGITLIVLILFGVFVIYSNLPDQTALQQNIDAEEGSPIDESVVLGEQTANLAPERPQSTNELAGVEVGSTGGLDEELRGIIDGFGTITEELELLEERPPGTSSASF